MVPGPGPGRGRALTRAGAAGVCHPSTLCGLRDPLMMAVMWKAVGTGAERGYPARGGGWVVRSPASRRLALEGPQP